MARQRVVILWDFDHTLFDAGALLDELKEEVVRRLIALSIPSLSEKEAKKIVDETYSSLRGFDAERRELTYSPTQHAHTITAKIREMDHQGGHGGGEFEVEVQDDLKRVVKELYEEAKDEVLSRAGDFLYEKDAFARLAEFRQEIGKPGIELQMKLLSFGDADWQGEKIQKSGAEKCFGSGELILSQRKVETLESYPLNVGDLVISINDRPTESLAMGQVLRERFGDEVSWHAIHMQRQNGRYSAEIDKLLTQGQIESSDVVHNLTEAFASIREYLGIADL